MLKFRNEILIKIPIHAMMIMTVAAAPAVDAHTKKAIKLQHQTKENFASNSNFRNFPLFLPSN